MTDPERSVLIGQLANRLPLDDLQPMKGEEEHWKTVEDPRFADEVHDTQYWADLEKAMGGTCKL